LSESYSFALWRLAHFYTKLCFAFLSFIISRFLELTKSFQLFCCQCAGYIFNRSMSPAYTDTILNFKTAGLLCYIFQMHSIFIISLPVSSAFFIIKHHFFLSSSSNHDFNVQLCLRHIFYCTQKKNLNQVHVSQVFACFFAKFLKQSVIDVFRHLQKLIMLSERCSLNAANVF